MLMRGRETGTRLCLLCMSVIVLEHFSRKLKHSDNELTEMQNTRNMECRNMVMIMIRITKAAWNIKITLENDYFKKQ